jgi:hypothetical protein
MPNCTLGEITDVLREVFGVYQETQMRLGYLKWDDWNIEHIAEQGVEPEEVESACHTRQALMRRAGVFAEKREASNEY